MSAGGLWGLATRRASATPDAVVVVEPGGAVLTAAELVARAERVAAGLAEVGVARGTVVSWILPNRIDACILTVALARLGAVQNPIVPILREREVSFIVRQAGSALLIVPGQWRGFDYRAMAEGIAGVAGRPAVLDVWAGMPEGDPTMLEPAPDAGDECRWILYTSGTTAEPKGARHTDAHLEAAMEGMVQRLALGPDDRFAFIAPITHVGGIIQLMGALVTGCRLLAVEVFEIDEVVRFFREQGVTVGGLGTPTFTAYLAYQRAHPALAPLFPAIRAFASGGAPTPSALHTELREAMGGVGVVSGWGLTEAPMLTWNSVHDPDEILATTEGRPIPGVELVVVGPDGRHLAAGEEGELRAKGPQVMLGYVDATLDAEAFDEHGYLRTGDLGVMDAEGNVRITGRLKDVIIRNMENISALELETLLFSHPAVAEVAVIGIPDPVTGERACAVVVPDGAPPSLADLCDHLRAAGLSTRKLPERLVVVDALPRNAMGKVAKAELRAAVLATDADTGTREPRGAGRA
jgi:acyl-CoA synthetase (AMP-forming)/AMP-acid ligase II